MYIPGFDFVKSVKRCRENFATELFFSDHMLRAEGSKCLRKI